jgi:hypothetical protein
LIGGAGGSGSLAMLAAIRRASSRVSNLATGSPAGIPLEIDIGERPPVGVGATKMRLGLPARAAFY